MAQLVEIKKVTVGPRDLDALVEIAPNAPLMTSEDIEATARVFHLMPELADHVCLGDAGRLFRDSMGHTELAHRIEMTGYCVPSEESLSFTAGITPFPDQNAVIVGLVADTGIVS